MPTFEERLAALEATAEANKLPPTVAILQRKLEASWQPDASVLLQQGSIIASLMGGVVDSDGKGFKLGGAAVRWGTDTLTWPGGSAFTNVTAVTHGMGKTPTYTYGNGSGVFTIATLVYLGAPGATTFQAAGWTPSGSPAAASTQTFSWIAIG